LVTQEFGTTSLGVCAGRSACDPKAPAQLRTSKFEGCQDLKVPVPYYRFKVSLIII